MHAKTHATLARRLIKACGGLEQAADNCRLEKSRLQEFQDHASEAFMPADVIADLESAAGEPIYSAALAKARPWGPGAKDAIIEGMETVESAADLMRLIRVAQEDGDITPAEALQIEGQLLTVEDQVRQTRAAIARAVDKPAGGEAAS